MTNVRFDLIDKEIAWAEAEEAKGEMSAWAQDRWVTRQAPCGTAYCIAGHLVAGMGRFLHNNNHRVVIDGQRRWIEDVAAEAFGLYDADELFAEDNTIADLKRIRDEMAVEEGVPTKYGGADQ